MSNDIVVIAIVALLPITSLLLVLQTNPYRALIVRGVIGAIAALVYALFGAADVALTEALVGTLLSMTLYAIAIRSSLPPAETVPASGATQPAPNQSPSIQPDLTQPDSTQLKTLPEEDS